MRCQIRVRGHLDDAWRERLSGLRITREPSGATLLTGPLTDQAALHGVLLQILRLGLPLLSLETDEAAWTASTADETRPA